MGPSNALSLIYPMFAMVILSAIVLIVVFRNRVRAVKEGQVKAAYYKIYQGGSEPAYAIQAARHFTNLFEAPTLFYAACLAAMIAHSDSSWIWGLAWLYVLARVIHAFIHLGKNRLRPRIAAYFLSWLALVGMWGSLVVDVTRRG
jgi:hypothetical protein